MSTTMKARMAWLLPAGLMAVFAAVAFAVVSLRQRPLVPQEVVLSARNVSFWSPDQPEKPNPPLYLTRGRPVQLTLRNDEPNQVLHCFTIGALEVKSTRDLATGESEVLRFTPREAGTFTYACLMHPAMAGKIVVP